MLGHNNLLLVNTAGDDAGLIASNKCTEPSNVSINRKQPMFVKREINMALGLVLHKGEDDSCNYHGGGGIHFRGHASAPAVIGLSVRLDALK